MKNRGRRFQDGPGVQKVIDYIRSELTSGRLRQGMLLPSRNELGRRLSLSADPIWRAMQKLKRDGVLAGVRGQRARVPSTSQEGPLFSRGRPAGVHTAVDVVAEQLKDDIITGAFPGGTAIPTCKELCGRYGASYGTLRKAINAVVNLDLLARKGRNFTVPAAALPAARASILFIWFSDKPYLPTHEHDLSFIRALERECLRNSVALEKLIAGIDASGSVVLWRHRVSAPVEKSIVDSCVGVVYLVNWFASANTTVFNWLAHLGKPVSIMDWLGDWKAPPALSGKPHIQLLRSSVTKRPGFDAGRFLISLGHKRIAYFSPYGLEWPAIRLQGIIDACALAGDSCRVTPFIQSQVAAEHEFQNLIREKYLPMQPVLDSPQGFPVEYQAGLTHLVGIAWAECENATHFNALLPLFEKALAQKQITAWVGCNDEVAIMAWSFLRSRQIAIPRKISIIGFGNTFEAAKVEITSYDLNHESAVGSIRTFLLRPGLASRIRKLARPLIEGFMIERGSTARV